MSGRIKTCKRQQILSSFALLLDKTPGLRITTAKIADEIGLPESVLYRHFPSKSKMFEGLIDVIESTLFNHLTELRAETVNALDYCERMLSAILQFSENNPGMSRVLSGEALIGESEQLRLKAQKVNEKLELWLSQTISTAEQLQELVPAMPANTTANLIYATIEGRISQFVRSGFQKLPTAQWQQHWQQLSNLLLSANKPV